MSISFLVGNVRVQITMVVSSFSSKTTMFKIFRLSLTNVNRTDTMSIYNNSIKNISKVFFLEVQTYKIINIIREI